MEKWTWDAARNQHTSFIVISLTWIRQLETTIEWLSLPIESSGLLDTVVGSKAGNPQISSAGQSLPLQLPAGEVRLCTHVIAKVKEYYTM